MFKKKSTAVASGASAATGIQPPVTAAPVGNPAVATHIKKQHIKHNKGMQASPTSVAGSAPASSVPNMPNPYRSS
jgi:hypothetical protein